jgi:hypothetical protein
MDELISESNYFNTLSCNVGVFENIHSLLAHIDEIRRNIY